MALQRYQDEFAAFEAGDRFGTYLTSYAAEFKRVEVHFFRSPDNRLMVFVTKSPGVPVAEAAAAARQAVEQFSTAPSAEESAPPHAPQVIYDGYGIGTSGSL